jgi:hypothetical protein
LNAIMGCMCMCMIWAACWLLVCMQQCSGQRRFMLVSMFVVWRCSTEPDAQ